jgi:5'-methylthioadenosine phosphorylase
MILSGQGVPVLNNRPIGIIGGSGIETFPEMDISRTVRLETPYGPPSDELSIGKIGERDVVFLPRHGGRIALLRIKFPIKRTSPQ